MHCGDTYEVRSDNTVIKYYSFAGQLVARNDGTGLQYFLTDHLGSVVAVTDASGALITQQRYLPFGGERTNVGTISQTDYGYTGQRDLDPGMGGLMDYKARFYSPYLNRFIQPDTLIPDPANSQAWNRYAYVYGNPIRFTDPTGHEICDEDGNCFNKGYQYKNRHKKTLTNKARENVDRRTPSRVAPPCSTCPDAILISFSFSSGSDSVYLSYGFDIVLTSDEIGIFMVNGKGVGLGSAERDPKLPLGKMRNTYMFPQISASVYLGGIWGDSINENVLNHRGPAKVKGGSLGVISIEKFVSVDAKTGEPNGDIHGWAIGGGFSLLPGEIHNIYTNADPIFSPGY